MKRPGKLAKPRVVTSRAIKPVLDVLQREWGRMPILGALRSSADSANDPLWHFLPTGNNQYKVENLLTHRVMGIANASASSRAQALQRADNGTNDHLWSFYILGDGNYLIKKVNSGLYLQLDTSASPAIIDQGARATTAPAAPARSGRSPIPPSSPTAPPQPVRCRYLRR